MHFNPQYIFNKQPMVFITLSFIIGIIGSKFVQIQIDYYLIIILLLGEMIFLRKLKYSFLFTFIVSMFSGNSLYLYNNQNFNRNLEGLSIIDDKKIKFEGMIIQVDNKTTGQRFIVKNVSIATEESSFVDEIRYIVYPKLELTHWR